MADVTNQVVGNGPIGALFDRTLYAVNPANYNVQTVTRLCQPFQADPAPPHFAPPRYPDLMCIPGVIGSGADPGRLAVVADAARRNLSDPMPMEIDDMGAPATSHLVEVGGEMISKEELFRRAFTKETQKVTATTAW